MIMVQKQNDGDQNNDYYDGKDGNMYIDINNSNYYDHDSDNNNQIPFMINFS